MDVETVEKLRDDLRRQLAPRTGNKVLAALSAIFDHAIKHSHTEKNPARVVDRLKLRQAKGESTNAVVEALAAARR